MVSIVKTATQYSGEGKRPSSPSSNAEQQAAHTLVQLVQEAVAGHFAQAGAAAESSPGAAVSTRSLSPEPAVSNSIGSAMDALPDQEDSVLKRIEPPSRMNQKLDFEHVFITVPSGHHGAAAFLVLLVLCSPSFTKLLSTEIAGELGLNIIKRDARAFVETFLDKGYFPIDRLQHLLRKLYDDSRRRSAYCQAVIALGMSAPATLHPYGVPERRDLCVQQVVQIGTTVNKILHPWGYVTRTASRYVLPPPQAEEYMRNFLSTFNKDNAFFCATLGTTFEGSLAEFCAQKPLQHSSANMLAFVRPPGWNPTSKAIFFPSPTLTFGDESYVLKGIMVMQLEDLEKEVAYDSYLFEGDAIFRYKSAYSQTENVECTRLEESAKAVWAQQECYSSAGLNELQGDETCPQDFDPELEEFILELMTNGDLFLYEKTDATSQRRAR